MPPPRRGSRRCVARRARGEPLAYLTGEREFFSLPLAVSPDVLVPRPETELLVEVGARGCSAASQRPAVLDVGTGSGAIALADQATRRAARVTATRRERSGARRRARRMQRGSRSTCAGSSRAGSRRSRDEHVRRHRQQSAVRAQRPTCAVRSSSSRDSRSTAASTGSPPIARCSAERASISTPDGVLLVEHGADQRRGARRARRAARLARRGAQRRSRRTAAHARARARCGLNRRPRIDEQKSHGRAKERFIAELARYLGGYVATWTPVVRRIRCLATSSRTRRSRRAFYDLHECGQCKVRLVS